MHARYSDGEPAADIIAIVGRSGAEERVEGLRRRTDATGTARFDELAPGRIVIGSDRHMRPLWQKVVAGETLEVELQLAAGLTLTGLVTDESDTPIAGALVEVAPLARADCDAEVLATTDANGRFTVRAASTATLVGARAHGYPPTRMQFLLGKPGNDAEVHLRLGKGGGSVDGVVVNGRGEPVAGAVVRIGTGQTSALTAGRDGGDPLPALVRTDADGRFRAIGVPSGTQPVQARAPRLRPVPRVL